MNVIVVLNYNDYQTTVDYLTRINEYNSVDKIIVVDNKSPDGSYEVLKKYRSSKIDVVQTKENEGYSSGNNYGVKYAEKNYDVQNFIISNPDIIVSEKSISNMIHYLNKQEGVGAVSGLIHNLNEEVVDNFAWKLPSYSDMMALNFMSINYLRKKFFNKGIEYSLPLKQKYFEVGVLHGCFFIVKATVMKEVNYFDEETFLYGEENIFAHKLKNYHYKQVVLRDEKIIHMEGVSINKSIKNWKTKYNHYEKSRSLYVKKYLKANNLQTSLFKLMFHIGKYEKFLLNKIRTV